MTTKPISDKDYLDVMGKINGLESLIQGWDIEGFAIRVGAYLVRILFNPRLGDFADPKRNIKVKRLQRLHRMAYHLNKFKKLAKKDIEIMERINSELPH